MESRGLGRTRRDFLKISAVAGAGVGLSLVGSGRAWADGRESGQTVAAGDDFGAGSVQEARPGVDYTMVPIAAAPDPESSFGVDLNINISTVDRYLGRPDTVYRDMRMLYDPADFESIGGNSELSQTVEGFRITPFPHMVSMPKLAVEGGYDGPALFSVQWADDNRTPAAVEPNYVEAKVILEELFPRHKNIFLMCGGGGYAGMMRNFLIHMGWDETKVFNIGGNWDYAGSHGVHLISYDAAGRPTYRMWRADYTLIEFDRLEKVGLSGEGALPDPVASQDPGRPTARRRGTKECIVA